MHRLGFSYKRTSKVQFALDDNCFVAQRAFYFRKLDELRKVGALIMFHDETWVNIGEEKRSIWIDDRGQGRIRKTDGKGNKLRILLVTVFMSHCTRARPDRAQSKVSDLNESYPIL